MHLPQKSAHFEPVKATRKGFIILLSLFADLIFSWLLYSQAGKHTLSYIVSPLALLKSVQTKSSIQPAKNQHQVFGFAPHWTIHKLDNVDFSVLTTLAYFGIPILADGNLNTEDIGYQTFMTDTAQKLFTRAKEQGTRVSVTLTLMENAQIEDFLDNLNAQAITIDQSIALLEVYNLTGINIDIEYNGNPGPLYRDKFSGFIKAFTQRLHMQIPNSALTVSVYAASVKQPKLYDIAALGREADGIFMMAYDFATTTSDTAMPTAPLYGYKEGKYWYDVSTAVDDFLTQMPAAKLILGVPYYGYNYVVYKPEDKARTLPSYSWRGKPMAQTYSSVEENIAPDKPGVISYASGWDETGQVGWKAYANKNNTWRMVFSENAASLEKKYDFAKEKQLAGVGIWALGFDNDRTELWDLLRLKFGPILAYSNN
jgi:spore germination protein YaaH